MIRADVLAVQFLSRACATIQTAQRAAPVDPGSPNNLKKTQNHLLYLLADSTISMRTSAAGGPLSEKGGNENCAVAPLPHRCAKLAGLPSDVKLLCISVGLLVSPAQGAVNNVSVTHWTNCSAAVSRHSTDPLQVHTLICTKVVANSLRR